MRLTANQYGKSRVRVMKIIRDGEMHTVKELDVAVSLKGDFESSYTCGDNHLVVPTDTMKNTVNVLAGKHLGLESERFAQVLALHFLEKFAQVVTASVTTSERVWDRMKIDATPHPYSFVNAQQARPTTSVVARRGAMTTASGIQDLLILKSTGSGFAGFPRCELTTLPESTDRILATSLTGSWTWTGEPANYVAANGLIISGLLRPFATNYSPSVQTSLFQMGEAALQSGPEIGSIHLRMPNMHCLPIDLAKFGGEDRRDLFLPTDEPHGLIEATVSRE